MSILYKRFFAEALYKSVREVLPKRASLYVECGSRINGSVTTPLFRAGIDYARAAGVHEGRTADEVIKKVTVAMRAVSLTMSTPPRPADILNSVKQRI